MMGPEHDGITVEEEIGTYDKDNWEVTVERQEVNQVLSEQLSVVKLPTDLLDIDLIRASTFTDTEAVLRNFTYIYFTKICTLDFQEQQCSTFTKAKPGYHWTQVTRSGFFKVIFFPLYYKWWLQQIPLPIWLFFLLLYFMQLLSLAIYLSNLPHEDFANISWPEAFVPLVAMVLLGEMYIHVVSTNFTKPIGHNIKKNKTRASDNNNSRKSRRKSRAEKSDSVLRRRLADRHVDSDEHAHDTSVERHSREESVERVLKGNEQHVLKFSENGDMPEPCTLRRRVIEKDTDYDVETYNSSPSEELSDSIQKQDRQKRKESMAHSSASVDEATSEESDTDSTTTSISDNDHDLMADTETANLLFPNSEGVIDVTQSNMLCQIRKGNDLITVSIWDGKSFKKAKLTFFEIGIAVVNKVESRKESFSDYITFAIVSSILIGMLPMLFRAYQSHVLLEQVQTRQGLFKIYLDVFGKTWRSQVIILIAMVSRIALSFSMFFLLCVAESAYKARYMYAKFFAAITSTRKSRRNGLPHFRLHKVKNIKAWLSLRSFLKKRGPQRSVDAIVSMAFMFDVLMLVITCIQFLTVNGKDEKDHFLSYFSSWEVSAWSLIVGVFLIRFITLGSDINRKYRNTSILLTEQINLYLQMEKNPGKKDELLIANNVLKLASKLLKDLEGPFKVSGFIMNPLLSNIVRVVVLSLFSGVMSDILGFRLRLWKIKA